MSFNRALELSIIVPTLNERENVPLLVRRIDASLRAADIHYEIVFIDDHSTDGTFDAVQELARDYPIAAYQKIGEPGKAYSIIQGVQKAKAETLCMIDADLQYPPEDIAPMMVLMKRNNADVILSNRLAHETSPIRQLASKIYNLLFIKLLFGIDYDTQAGLKVFRKDIFMDIDLDPSPWSFDLEFILQCLMGQYRILTHDIVFGSRHSGSPKLKIVKTSFELAKASLLLRARISPRVIKPAYEANVRFDSKVAKVTS